MTHADSHANSPCQDIGVIIVDHGSVRDEANQMLEQFVQEFAKNSPYCIIEPAHMELAEPSIESALARCTEQHAKQIVVIPYFLLPGKHWVQDIPRLTKQAADRHGQIPFVIGEPIGLHPMMHQVIQARLDQCAAQM